MGLTAHGTWKFKSNPTVNVKHATPGYCYRCPYGLEYPSCDVKCARDVEDLIRYETPGEVACFIAEPIQGVGGAVTPPPEYFEIVYEIVRKHGGLCIADEVQTGFGRTGTHSGASRTGASRPTWSPWPRGSATARRSAPASPGPRSPRVMKNRVHFNTFGGNPISMTQGLATLEVIDSEGIQENALRVGGHLKDRLLELQERQPLIGEVRGMGLMLGVELVRDRQTKEPATTETADLLELCKERGLLIGKGGLYGNTLRIKPPMCLTTRRRRLPGRLPGRGADADLGAVDRTGHVECRCEIASRRSSTLDQTHAPAARSARPRPAASLAWYSFQVIGGLPVSTSCIVMQPSTGQTRLHMLQPTHVSSLIVKRLIDVAAGPGQDLEAAGVDHAVARAVRRQVVGRRQLRSQRIDWWQPSSQAM